MSEHKLVWGLLATAALAAALLTWRYGSRSEVAPGSLDPAAEHYTADTSSHFGGVEQWAFRGMARGAFRHRIEGAGYACTEPAARQLACARQARWPLARTLHVHASFDALERLVQATTESRLASDSGLGRRAAALARRAGWIEAESASISGFELETVDLVARLVADSLRGTGWLASCQKAANLLACADQARARKASGFPPVPAGPVGTGTVTEVIRSLELMRLQPLRPRGADRQGEDALLVRVAQGRQWLDYVGADLGGRAFGVSISLALEGGAPTQAVVHFGGEHRDILLAGRQKTANGGAPLFLLPQAVGGDYRFADFHGHPDIDRPGTMTSLQAALPGADPAFRAPMARHLLSAIAAPLNAEETLGLEPALILVEERADLLRAAGARDWLAAEDRWRLVADWFREQPVMRAAWAHAVCDADPDEPGNHQACWGPVLAEDAEVSELLRGEVSRHAAAAAPLSERHPLRIRLQRWGRLWGGA